MMMKMMISVVVLALPLSFTWAESDAHDKAVEDVLSEIRSGLDLGSTQTIDPDNVPEALLERLGDAVMSEIHPGEKQHDWMDQMMGGEGSESLASAHRWMGYRYLDGGYSGEAMGQGMMGGGSMMGSRGMMGDPNFRGMSGPYDSPEDILDRRLSEGEISRRQHRRMMRSIDKGSSE